METQHVLPTPVVKEPFNFSDFLQFRRMLTLQIIPVMYTVVAILITLGSLGVMFSSGRRSYYDSGFSSFGAGGFFGGLVILVVGNVIWRMWCEFIIVLFRINKSLKDVEKNTRQSTL